MKQQINEVKRMQQLAGVIKENEEYLTPDQIRLIKSKDDSGESEAIEWRKLEAIITNLAPYHTLENIISAVEETYNDAKNTNESQLNEDNSSVKDQIDAVLYSNWDTSLDTYIQPVKFILDQAFAEDVDIMTIEQEAKQEMEYQLERADYNKDLRLMFAKIQAILFNAL